MPEIKTYVCDNCGDSLGSGVPTSPENVSFFVRGDIHTLLRGVPFKLVGRAPDSFEDDGLGELDTGPPMYCLGCFLDELGVSISGVKDWLASKDRKPKMPG